MLSKFLNFKTIRCHLKTISDDIEFCPSQSHDTIQAERYESITMNYGLDPFPSVMSVHFWNIPYLRWPASANTRWRMRDEGVGVLRVRWGPCNLLPPPLTLTWTLTSGWTNTFTHFKDFPYNWFTFRWTGHFVNNQSASLEKQEPHRLNAAELNPSAVAPSRVIHPCVLFYV